MLAFKYLLGVFLFVGVFQLGKLMTRHSHKLSNAPVPAPVPAPVRAHLPSMQKVVLYGGRVFQVVAVIWGFLDAVSVLVLVF